MSSASLNGHGEGTNRSVALIGTITIHALILLFLIWYVIITPIPPYPAPKTPEVEVAVDFGNNINGTGNVEAPNKGDNPNQDKSNTQNASKSSEPSNGVLTNNTEDNPPMAPAKNKKQTVKIDSTPEQPHESVELAAALNKFKHSKGSGNPGGNGNSGETGNAGSPDGKTPGVGNGNTPGGTEYFLTGRSLISHPIPVNVSKDQGKVVVEIIVDPNGNVIKATPGAKGSTTSSPYLFEKAKEAALATRFSKSSDPNTPQQEGTMTIVFSIQ